mmetsp:Transcript_32304/g.106823  ORF Transcript_32304/g.106823 Transcript_32304/m.106823 type:complete len:212 (-) Transcript_32304:106-741(-)
MSTYFKHQGKCAANLRSNTIDLEAPSDLVGLDALHKMSTGRRVATMRGGCFSTRPREGSNDAALKRQSESVPSQVFLDPYHVGDGNLFSDRLSSGAPNVRMEQYQLGGQTCKAARGRMLVWDKERPPDLGPEARKRSRYVTPPQGRFVPPLKSWCARAMSSTDPYGIGDRPCIGVIQDTAFRRTVDGPAAAGSRPEWSTYCLSRGARVSHG